jgi:hypothetical protein
MWVHIWVGGHTCASRPRCQCVGALVGAVGARVGGVGVRAGGVCVWVGCVCMCRVHAHVCGVRAWGACAHGIGNGCMRAWGCMYRIRNGCVCGCGNRYVHGCGNRCMHACRMGANVGTSGGPHVEGHVLGSRIVKKKLYLVLINTVSPF